MDLTHTGNEFYQFQLCRRVKVCLPYGAINLRLNAFIFDIYVPTWNETFSQFLVFSLLFDVYVPTWNEVFPQRVWFSLFYDALRLFPNQLGFLSCAMPWSSFPVTGFFSMCNYIYFCFGF